MTTPEDALPTRVKLPDQVRTKKTYCTPCEGARIEFLI